MKNEEDFVQEFCEAYPTVTASDARYWFKKAEAGDLRDALSHIRHTAESSRSQTRRLRWIALRADCALRGTDEWRTEDLPRIVEGPSRRERMLSARVRELEEQLAQAKLGLFSKLYKKMCG